MTVLKYKDKDGFWQELKVGTKVVANPTLTGTEAELTGLKVGGTDYKIPSVGVQFVELFPGSVLTEEKLATLKANKANQIIYYGGVKYYFKLAYEKSDNEWLYDTFYDSAVTLTVNMTTGSATFGSSGKLYWHSLYFASTINPTLLTFYSTSPTKVTDEWIFNNLASGYYPVICYALIESISQNFRIGICDVLHQITPPSKWGAYSDFNSESPIQLSVSQAEYTIIEL